MSAEPHDPTIRLHLLRDLERELVEKMPARLGTLAAVRSLIMEAEAELAKNSAQPPTSQDAAGAA